MKHRTLFAVCLAILSTQALGEEGVKALLGFVPGEESGIPLPKRSHPFSTERVPTLSEKLNPFFPDLQLFIIAPENLISGVVGRKSMIDSESCDREFNALKGLIKKEWFPNLISGPTSGLYLQSNDGEMVAKLSCVHTDENPYPVLELIVEHTKTAQEHENRLRAFMR